jgi:hypothetical protein
VRRDCGSPHPWRERSRRGSVAVLVAAGAAFMVAAGGISLEIGNAYMTRTQTQRIADMAAYAGGTAYMNNNSSTTAMNAAVQRIATLNGLSATAITASIVVSPSGDGKNAVFATATTAVTLALTSMIRNSSTMAVHASAYAEVSNSGQACIIGLTTTGNSVTEDGGATVTGTSCAVAAANNLSISGGSRLTALGVYTVGTVSNTGGSTITTTPTAGNINQGVAASSVTDPVHASGVLTMPFATLGSLSGSVAAPTTPAGVTLTFDYSCTARNTPSTDPACAYYTSSGNYTTGSLPCTGGSYAINSISVSGGVNVNIGTTAGCNYTVASGISDNGSSLQITGTVGNFFVNGGISAGGGTTLTLPSASTWWVYNSSGSGISIGGSSVFTLGAAATVEVHGSSGNYSVTNGGGSTMTMTAGTYLMDGPVSLSGIVNWNTSGSSPVTRMYSTGSTLTTGSSGGPFTFGGGNYYVNGAVSIGAAPVYFGNALLEINGNLTVSSGGSLCATPAPCSSGTATMTIIDNGVNTFSGGSTTHVVAPASGATVGIAGIALASNYTAAGTYSQVFSGGTSGSWAGVIYFPNTGVEYSGGASTAGGGCFEIVASLVYMTGGTTTATTCSGYGASAGGSAVAKLVE